MIPLAQITDADLARLFDHRADCYAKTTDDRCHAAMTAERFAEVVGNLLDKTGASLKIKPNQIRQTFDNQSNCYAEPLDDCTLAISSERFVELVRATVV